jgi:hypothetical protein
MQFTIWCYGFAGMSIYPIIHAKHHYLAQQKITRLCDKIVV